jgi:antitoxin component YwqK of YwqJK toxin-antitoxin module
MSGVYRSMEKIIRIVAVLNLLFINQTIWAQIHSKDFKEPYEDKRIGIALKGSIKSIETEEYSMIDYFGELKKDTIYNVSTFILNDNNFPVNAILTDYQDGLSTLDWTYFNNKTKDFKAVKNDVVIEQVTFKFDDKGNILECSSFKNGALEGKEFAVYDRNNNEIEFKRYNDKGIVAESSISKYDLRGKLIEQEVFADWGYNAKYIYKYINGLKSEDLYFSNDILDKKTSYKYYETGKIKEEIEQHIKYGNKWISYYNLDGNFVQRVSIKTDGNKEILETTKYDSNKRIVFKESSYGKTYFKYNDKGYLIKEETQQRNYKGLIKEVILYEYDYRGNWIKCIKSNFDEGNPIESPKKIIRERKITYR